MKVEEVMTIRNGGRGHFTQPTLPRKWPQRSFWYLIIKKLKRISLRKFAISDSPDNFCLSEIVDTSRGAERVLDPFELLYSLHQSYHGPLKLYIRKKVYTSDSQFDMPEDYSH